MKMTKPTQPPTADQPNVKTPFDKLPKKMTEDEIKSLACLKRKEAICQFFDVEYDDKPPSECDCPKCAQINVEEKECTQCNRALPLTKFHRQLGEKRASACAECRSKYDKVYYRENRKRVLSRQKQWIKDNRDACNERWSKYRKKLWKTKEGRNRLSAGNAVYQAIKSGRLKRMPCEVCGESKSEAHHHNGYDKEHWLDVQWLCRKHHLEAEGKSVCSPEEYDK